MTLAPPHPRYVLQVLSDRGIRPSPSAEAVQCWSAALTVEDGHYEAARLRRIAAGVEDTDEAAELLAQIQAAHQQGPEQLAPALTDARPPVLAEEREFRGSASPVPKQHADAAELVKLRASGFHVYGSRAAAKIELTALRRSAASDRKQYTVQVEGAGKLASGFDWHHKIIFQLMARELPLMAAFLLGFAGDQISLTNHGPNADKFLSLEDQGSRMFLKLGHAGERPIALPVEAPEVFRWGETVVSAMHLNQPDVPPELLPALLRRVGGMMMAEKPRGHT